MPPRTRATKDGQPAPRREKPVGKMARFADARKNNNDLLADCERLLLREAEQPQQQNGGLRRNDVIHPSEMAKSNWCPRSTYLRILATREGRLPEVTPHHFQLENIFEEGHEYHRKWQDRFWRMGRLFGIFFCEACEHRWPALAPKYCPECGAPRGALTYHEVPLRSPAYMIHGNTDGIVMGLFKDRPDVMIEIKSIGEGTVRQDLPQVYMRHTHEIDHPQWAGKTMKVLDHRGIWKEITKPFGSHLKQGLIYLRLLAEMDNYVWGGPKIDLDQIVFLYEYKPTSATKAFYVARDDEAVQELWDSAADIVYALDKGGRPPRCIDRDEPCKECKPYEEQESEHDGRTTTARGAAQEEPRGRRRARAAEPAAAEEAEDRGSRPRRSGSDRPGRSRPDRPDGAVREVGGLLGRPARSGRGR